MEAISKTTAKWQSLAQVDWRQVDWQEELKMNIRTMAQLKEYLPPSAKDEELLSQVIELHPMNIPRYYLSLINPDDNEDPIRKLCVPDVQELIVAGEMGDTTNDPYGDDKHDKGNGILQKYEYSVLAVTTENCAMYCRNCFRKRMVGLPNDLTVKNFQSVANYIAERPAITNIIMSGGDPLMLSTGTLIKMLNALRGIKHLNHIRLGSRMPVTYPMRLFDEELIDFLRDYSKEKTLFAPTHFNHPREITPLAREAVWRLRSAGITVNNQAVLLRGVNDSAATLVDLMNGLLRIGVSPYYLYQCMPVERVRHHFQVPLKEGIDIVDKARQSFDGYAKRFKFIIAHDIGKLEIVGRIEDVIVLKQVHARIGHEEQGSRILLRRLTDKAGWLDDLPAVTNLDCSASEIY
jgi:KamA family protein